MTNQDETITLKTIKMEEAGYRTTMVSTYAAIARRHLSQAESLKLPHGSLLVSAGDVQEVQAKNPNMDLKTAAGARIGEQLQRQAEADEHAHIAVVFAHMALEAYIYDYGTRKFPPGFFGKYLDRLPILKKIKAITEFGSGKPFPTNGAPWKALTDLNKARNGLIHFKAKEFRGDQESLKQLHTSFWVEKAQQAIQALDAFAETMAELDPEEARALNHFKPASLPQSAILNLRTCNGSPVWVEWPLPPVHGGEDVAADRRGT